MRYLLRDIDGSADNAVQPVALHYRVGTTGNYTNVPAAFVADASTGPSVATLETPVDVTLPADANNQTVVELRILTTNAAGNDEWIGVDDIQITGETTGTPAETASAALSPTTATVVEGQSTNLSVTYALGSADSNDGNNPAVSGSVVVATGDPAQVSFTGAFSFPQGTLPGATQTVAVTAVNDAVFTGTRQVGLGLGPVTGGTGSGTTMLTITDDDPPPTTVQFAQATATAAESAGAVAYNVSITNPSSTSATTVNVALTGGTGTAADLDNFTTQTLTFGPGQTAPEELVVLVTDDAAVEGNETFVFTLQNVTGGNSAVVGTPGTFTLTLTDNDTAPPPAVVINEIDAAMADNSAEFVEMIGPPNTPVDGLVLVFYNGNGDVSYRAINLTGSTDANGLYLVGNPGLTPAPTITFPVNTLQNGQDAVALYVGTAASFPTGTAPTTANLVDAILYGGNDPGLEAGLGLSVSYTETATTSAARLNRAGGAFSPEFYQQTPSPGALNSANLVANRTVQPGRGYRLLSAPVEGVTVGTLADLNLVQSVVGQYPEWPNDNVFLGYTGEAYVPAANVADVVEPGRGFFWLLFDEAITPDPASQGGGTSQSYPLAGRPLTATGPALFADVDRAFAQNAADGFYMLGNPFAQGLRTAGVTQTAGGGVFSNFLQLYDPSPAGYVVVSRTSPRTLSAWQGFFGEVVGGAAPTFRYLAAQRTADTTLVSREAAPVGVALRLAGTTAAGAETVDAAAHVHLAPEADLGWDAGDASKLTPPGGPYALVAVVGDRLGEAWRQAVRSLPVAAHDVPLAVMATDAGSYRLTATAALPDGWRAELRDLATGATTTDLAAGLPVELAGATAWTDRFVLALTSGLVSGAPGAAEAAFEVSAPRPNPATGRTALSVRVAAPGTVRATVLDALGRVVQTAFEGEVADRAEVSVDASGLAPGVYVVRVEAAGAAESRRLTVVR